MWAEPVLTAGIKREGRAWRTRRLWPRGTLLRQRDSPSVSCWNRAALAWWKGFFPWDWDYTTCWWRQDAQGLQQPASAKNVGRVEVFGGGGGRMDRGSVSGQSQGSRAFCTPAQREALDADGLDPTSGTWRQLVTESSLEGPGRGQLWGSILISRGSADQPGELMVSRFEIRRSQLQAWKWEQVSQGK